MARVKAGNPHYPYRRIICILILVLIVVHGLFDQWFKIDPTSLALLGLAIIVFYLPMIRKFKWNDFEAEIKAEINDAAEVVQELPVVKKGLTEGAENEAIRRLLE